MSAAAHLTSTPHPALVAAHRLAAAVPAISSTERKSPAKRRAFWCGQVAPHDPTGRRTALSLTTLIRRSLWSRGKWQSTGSTRWAFVAEAIMIRTSILAALMWCTVTMAAAADDLYRAQAVVTGQGEANRIIGFAFCLEDVLIKVSGALKLAGDPRLAAYRSSAGDFVKSFRYHDQMSGTPTRDEQGTRDRPYDLIVDFDEKKVDGLLYALGLTPWLSHRPVLSVFVEMVQGPRKYIVTADAERSAAPRDSL